MALYSDPVLQKLIDKLNDANVKELKGRFYQGDPVVFPQSKLPACFVSRDRTTVEMDDTANDRHRMNIVLNVVYNFMNDINQSASLQAGTVSIYDIVEGRGSDYSLNNNSLMYVLRNFEVLDGNNKLYIDIGSSTEVEYLISPPSRRGAFSVEAVVRTTLINNQLRPGA